MNEELWGLKEFAQALGVSPMLARQWKRRGKLPEPDWVISGRPVWRADRAREWLRTQRRSTPSSAAR